ncbi:MAG: energy-coupling factor transporter transmembrane component T [bacterium]|nr:energy-coupling factor transporter transmembrane component T [bacterium]
MLRDLTLGRYYPGDSVLHRLDPRSKLLGSLVLMVALFAVTKISVIILFLFGVMILYIPARIPLRMFWGNVRVFAWLYLITLLIHLFLHPGQALFTLPVLGWTVSVEGLYAGILFSIRIAILVTLSSLLMSVTTPQELTDGLERLFSPLTRLKVPVSEGALMISIALRFVPILLEEADKIRRAQLARGADLDGVLPVRIKKSLPMILPLFSGALKKADDLALALEARGYRGGQGRTQLVVLHFSVTDALVLVFALIIAALLFILR